jgi:hypothetical protein
VGEAISDFQGLRHLAPVIGPVPSTPTVWRALAEIGQPQLTRLNAAVTSFRRHWWGLLAQRREGFPWLRVAGRELTGITVVDLDASLVHAASDSLGQPRTRRTPRPPARAASGSAQVLPEPRDLRQHRRATRGRMRTVVSIEGGSADVEGVIPGPVRKDRPRLGVRRG